MATGMLAYMSVNAGRLPLARAYCTEALQLASAIESTDLLVWVRGTQSLEAYYAGRYTEALDFAAAGIRAAPLSSQSIRLLSNGVARALGKLGDRRGAEKALDQAITLSEKVEAPSGLTSCISFGTYGLARTLANAATVHLSLGNYPAVLEYAGEVDDHVEAADSAWSRALVSLDVATALLQQQSPEVERAMGLGRAALESCRDHPIRSVVQRAGELSEQARAIWKDGPAVLQYGEALAKWQAEPAAAILLVEGPSPSASLAVKERHDALRAVRGLPSVPG
jgi:tetratricopeptide (TPR) repeat protein